MVNDGAFASAHFEKRSRLLVSVLSRTVNVGITISKERPKASSARNANPVIKLGTNPSWEILILDRINTIYMVLKDWFGSYLARLRPLAIEKRTENSCE